MHTHANMQTLTHMWTSSRPSKERPDALVIAGGGAKAISALGAIHVLHTTGKLRNLRVVAGTSAGAIVSASLALGRPSIDVCRAFVDDVYAPDFDLTKFSSTFGLDTGFHIDRMIRMVLDGDTHTFDSIRRVRGIDLMVCATNLSQRKPVYFSSETTPDVDVATAIRMSCAIPLYFRSVTYEGDVYVDGGLCDNFPYEWIANRPNVRFPLGITYATKYDREKVDTLDKYLAAIVQCSTGGQRVRDKAHVLELDCGDAKIFDFKSPRVLKRVFKSGVVQTRQWIKKNQ